MNKQMKREALYSNINERLSTLSVAIKTNGKLNNLGLHHHSENFYSLLLNNIYGWNTKNMNPVVMNAKAIDLVDETRSLITQISATCTKSKIDSSLKKIDLEKYKGYNFKFITISEDASELRKKDYENVEAVSFNPLTDILDIHSIMRDIDNFDVPHQQKIWDFVQGELGTGFDEAKVYSGLAKVVSIISKEDLNIETYVTKRGFDVEDKISFNELKGAGELIRDFFGYSTRLNRIYSEFDKEGKNVSLTILSQVRNVYLKSKDKESKDELFFLIIESVKKIVTNSKNYTSMSSELLEFCVNIIVVDAFVRCKIFENPNKNADS